MTSAAATASDRRVAVMMCVYAGDRAEFVREAADSITAQAGVSPELHVYVDGPVGSELERVLDDLGRSPAVHVHRWPTNRGLAYGLNHIIQATRGKYRYFARMDADDVALRDRLKRQVDYLERAPTVDVLGGAIIDIEEDGTPLQVVEYPLCHDEMRRFFRRRNPIAHVTVMYRESYFEKAGLYPETRLEDGLYWMQGFKSGCRFANLKDPLVSVRRSADFLRRRSGVRTNLAELGIKFRINRELQLGPMSYLYALAMCGIQLLPVPMKAFLYERLR